MLEVEIGFFQTEFSKAISMAFDDKEMVRWTNLDTIRLMMVTGNFNPANVYITVFLQSRTSSLAVTPSVTHT